MHVQAQRCLQRTAMKRPTQPVSSAGQALTSCCSSCRLWQAARCLLLLDCTGLVISSLPVSLVLAATAVVRDYLRLQRSGRTAQF